MCIKEDVKKTTSGDEHTKKVFNWLVDNVNLLRFSMLVAIIIVPIFAGMIIYIYQTGMSNVNENHNLLLAKIDNKVEVNKDNIKKNYNTIDRHANTFDLHYFKRKD